MHSFSAKLIFSHSIIIILHPFSERNERVLLLLFWNVPSSNLFQGMLLLLAYPRWVLKICVVSIGMYE